MNKVAIGRVVLTSREHIIALEPLDKGLMGTLLRYPYEVRSEQEYFDEIQDVKVTKDMLDLAKHIVNQKAGRFKPGKFEDQYEAALVELINSKRAGKPVTAIPACSARIPRRATKAKSWIAKMHRILHDILSEAGDQPLGHFAVDDSERTAVAFVGVHIAGGDVEPPTAQMKRSGRDRRAHDRIGHQVFDLHQHVELRQLVMWL